MFTEVQVGQIAPERDATVKGRLGYWLKLAERAAFRKGIGTYCGHKNTVESGMWAGASSV